MDLTGCWPNSVAAGLSGSWKFQSKDRTIHAVKGKCVDDRFMTDPLGKMIDFIISCTGVKLTSLAPRVN